MHAKAMPVIRTPALTESTEVFNPPSAVTYLEGDVVAEVIAFAVWDSQLKYAQDHSAYRPIHVKPVSELTDEEVPFSLLIISANRPGVTFDPKKQFIAGGTKKAPEYDGPGSDAREIVFIRSNVKETAAGGIADKIAPRFTWNYRQTVRERRQQQEGQSQHQLVETAAQTVIATLNQGPDFRGELASADYSSELPKHQRFSWALVPDAPIQVDRSAVVRIERALVALQRSVSKLAMSRPAIRHRLAQGVALRDPELLDAYLNPPTDHYDLTARSDLHYSDGRLVVGEIDEMPGGEGLTYLVDQTYGVNEAAWRKRFDAVASEGTVLWVLADWSEVYTTELTWFVAEANRLGYPFRIATKNELSEIHVDHSGVTFRGERIGRVRRLFAIWEPENHPVLKELVLAAMRGVVSLDQPYGWFGNKALFALFFEYRSELYHLLGKETHDLLLSSIPETRFIDSEDPRSFQDDNRAVMKIIGANDRAARSYGVQIFKSLSAVKRVEWMLAHRDTPLIRQECFDYDRVPLAAFDTRTNRPFVFEKGRLMVRPWRTGSELTAGLAMIGEDYKVHGGVGTATVSTAFVD